ncbi:MAG: zinc ribbon domain-containing protein [Candidatus Hodarchaeota archaeon]
MVKNQHKAKIKKTIEPTFIEAKQGTMMTNTGHDPNWKKRIRINFYDLEGLKTLVRIEAAPLARNIFRVEKLKQSWFEGLFSHLFTLLHTVETSRALSIKPKTEYKIANCPNCGKKIDDYAKICPMCGIDINLN